MFAIVIFENLEGLLYSCEGDDMMFVVMLETNESNFNDFLQYSDGHTLGLRGGLRREQGLTAVNKQKDCFYRDYW